MAIGVWVIRRRRRLANLLPSALQARNGLVVTYLASCILLLVFPWYVYERSFDANSYVSSCRVPPKSGHADVSFWHATYAEVHLSQANLVFTTLL